MFIPICAEISLLIFKIGQTTFFVLWRFIIAPTKRAEGKSVILKLRTHISAKVGIGLSERKKNSRNRLNARNNVLIIHFYPRRQSEQYYVRQNIHLYLLETFLTFCFILKQYPCQLESARGSERIKGKPRRERDTAGVKKEDNGRK